ncbi:MAG: hypothetical protein WBA97_26325 [Actinophytocola sp.]
MRRGVRVQIAILTHDAGLLPDQGLSHRSLRVGLDPPKGDLRGT